MLCSLSKLFLKCTCTAGIIRSHGNRDRHDFTDANYNGSCHWHVSTNSIPWTLQTISWLPFLLGMKRMSTGAQALWVECLKLAPRDHLVQGDNVIIPSSTQLGLHSVVTLAFESLAVQHPCHKVGELTFFRTWGSCCVPLECVEWLVN